MILTIGCAYISPPRVGFECCNAPRFDALLAKSVSVRSAIAFGDWPPVHSYDDEAGFDEVQPRCDICNFPQWLAGDDWNGETGNHRSCELGVTADDDYDAMFNHFGEEW